MSRVVRMQPGRSAGPAEPPSSTPPSFLDPRGPTRTRIRHEPIWVAAMRPSYSKRPEQDGRPWIEIIAPAAHQVTIANAIDEICRQQPVSEIKRRPLYGFGIDLKTPEWVILEAYGSESVLSSIALHLASLGYQEVSY